MQGCEACTESFVTGALYAGNAKKQVLIFDLSYVCTIGVGIGGAKAPPLFRKGGLSPPHFITIVISI